MHRHARCGWLHRQLQRLEIDALKLSPYRLLFSRRSWYVIGRSSVHREVRTFNVGRVGELVLLGRALSPAARVQHRPLYGQCLAHDPQPGPDQDVTVRFGRLWPATSRKSWHKTQRLVPRDDGSLDFHVRVAGLDESRGGFSAMAIRPRCSSRWSYGGESPSEPSGWLICIMATREGRGPTSPHGQSPPREIRCSSPSTVWMGSASPRRWTCSWLAAHLGSRCRCVSRPG